MLWQLRTGTAGPAAAMCVDFFEGIHIVFMSVTCTSYSRACFAAHRVQHMHYMLHALPHQISRSGACYPSSVQDLSADQMKGAARQALSRSMA